MTASEKRRAVKEKYQSILGRNIYSQDSEKRKYVYNKYKDGRYYSDCSSSILRTYGELGLIPQDKINGNTAVMHTMGELVDCKIQNGIPDESKLLPGDILLFRGNDPSRPLCIGHVEMYVGNGRIYGHGSDAPSEKDLKVFCKSRYLRISSTTHLDKGLAEVRRFIPDDEVLIQVDARLYVTADILNVRDKPSTEGKIVCTVEKGELCYCSEKCNKWFYINGLGWISSNYAEGLVTESDGRTWIMKQGYTWDTSDVIYYRGKNYAVDSEGWIVTPDRMNGDGSF